MHFSPFIFLKLCKDSASLTVPLQSFFRLALFPPFNLFDRVRRFSPSRPSGLEVTSSLKRTGGPPLLSYAPRFSFLVRRCSEFSLKRCECGTYEATFFNPPGQDWSWMSPPCRPVKPWAASFIGSSPSPPNAFLSPFPLKRTFQNLLMNKSPNVVKPQDSHTGSHRGPRIVFFFL